MDTKYVERPVQWKSSQNFGCCKRKPFEEVINILLYSPNYCVTYCRRSLAAVISLSVDNVVHYTNTAWRRLASHAGQEIIVESQTSGVTRESILGFTPQGSKLWTVC